jgi:hypothetical protein
MKSQLVTFPKVIDGRPASVRVNAAAAKTKEYAKYTWVLCLSVQLRKPGPDGIVMPEEVPHLAAIEQALAHAASPEIEAAYVGALQTGGRLDLYVYCRNVAEAIREADVALSDFQDNACDMRCWSDPEWKAYHTWLYPTSSDWLYISARTDASKSAFGRGGVMVQQVNGK